MVNFGSIMGIIIIISCILAIFVPIFIMQIRDATKRIDKKMDKILFALSALNQNNPALSPDNLATEKRCSKCGGRNTLERYTCIMCGADL